MAYKFFSHNGEILPIAEAVVPLESVEYSYGFGVYETIRVNKSEALFLDEHLKRLNHSAEIIGLEHVFTLNDLKKSVAELVKKNAVQNCNLKILLIGGRAKDSANLYILCLNPLYPDRNLYKTGAKTITQRYERPFPHAKSLNMLPSYLAYREAKKAGAYDALAVDRIGNITEGTRTNFFAIKDRVITSPPEKDILPGVTRSHVLKVAGDSGFKIIEKEIPLTGLGKFDGAFLTSTSTKIMPVIQIDDYKWQEIPASLRELINAFNQFMSEVS